MNAKRFVAFLLIVVLTLGAVAITSPHLVKQIRLGLDLKGGFEILYVATPIDENGTVTKASLKETARSLQKRIDKQGIAEPDITTEGEDRIRVRIAGVTDEEKVRETLKKPANLLFKGPDGTVELDGRDFVPGGATVQYDNNQPIVAIKLQSAEKFGEVTKKLLGSSLGIYLDDEMISNPRIDTVINQDTAVITGRFTFEEANNLANTINLGALPLNLTEKYTQSVGASLGQLSLDQTVKAGIIASVIILAFMLIFYRLPGVVASITIVTYVWLLLLAFYLMKATLTLPGIAAFVLGVGMAVDANIIMYERIKEEIRSGKSLLSSLRAGSKHSFRTIMDANITNIIASGVLYTFGNGGIRGFALTAIMSTIISIITNIFFSRLLIHLLIRSNLFTKPAYYGVKEAEIREL
ncbi:protein translocase subunit SecD [Paenibacillus contaminans]|uniref:Protein translocase subunit SecD n=1 Tax=Paenibacillus contaminans TaxID=450362 RepID=A0A329MQY5_9BACL|nr:protein translocase subunit SecD [Paenibacillus contaminans]RAV21942.1 protein translocase subunit SecD [Paenibacillus contaminans]